MHQLVAEILSGNYTKSCDIWALGIILFVLLSGEVPYEYNNHELYNYKKGKFIGIVQFENQLKKEIVHKNVLTAY